MKNMRGEVPPAEWVLNKTYVKPWAAIPFCLTIGGGALLLAGLVWWLS